MLLELEQFIASADAFNVSGTDDLYVLQEDGVSPESKALVTQVLQRIEDVTVMCEKHITNLRRLLVKPNRPIQSVSPEVVTNNARELAAEENQKEFNSCFSNGLAEK
ncbi:unnamed protein product, partial [Ilex paraguariensis]